MNVFDFGLRLLNLLADSGHTQTELAKYINIKPATVSSWIAGKASPQFDKLETIAHYFHLSLAELFTDSPPGDLPSPSIVFSADASDVAQIAPGSDVRVELRTPPEIGDVVLYKSGEDARLLRLAAYRDGISVLMSDKPGDAPVIAKDSDNEIIGTATAILLKRDKKTAPAATDAEIPGEIENDQNSGTLYPDR